MQLRSRIAVAVAVVGSCSFDSVPSLGTSICYRCVPKKPPKKKKKKKKRIVPRQVVKAFPKLPSRGPGREPTDKLHSCQEALTSLLVALT